MRSGRAPRAVLFLLFSCGTAAAAPIAVPNGDFENDPLADGAANFGTTHWASFGGVGFGAGAYNPTSAQYAAEAPQGSNVGWMIAFNSAGLAQTLGVTYEAGTTYTLTALVGDRDDYARADFQLALFASGLIVSQGGFAPAPAEGAFALVTATFEADASVDGVPIEIRLLAFTSSDVDPDQPPGTGGTIVDYDDVQLDASPTPTSANLRDGTVQGIVLHPAAPNPFDLRTTVAFDLPASAPVNISVFDASGRNVRVLMRGEAIPAGRREVAWDGRNDRGDRVAAGVYYCRLEAGGRSRTVPVVLVK